MQLQDAHTEPLPVAEKEAIAPAAEAAPGKEPYGVKPAYFLFCFLLGWLATVVVCLFVRSMV
ncbi:MAG: hypothetical protein ACTHOF_05230 [Flavisolibacter sp.]